MNPNKKINIRQTIKDYKKIREILENFVSECNESKRKESEGI